MSDTFFQVMSQAMGPVKNLHNRTPMLLNYLPAIFHPEAGKKHSPLWTLLLMIEDNFASISKIIDDIDRYFDIYRVPDGSKEGETDFLSWLGSWLGLIPEKNWPEAKKRYALRIAVQLHKFRGTVTGLHYMLALFFEIDVKIEQWTWPDSMQTGILDTIGVDTRIDDRYDINNSFMVTWEPIPEELKEPGFREKVANIRALIDREKPAHTWCYFNVTGFEDD